MMVLAVEPVDISANGFLIQTPGIKLANVHAPKTSHSVKIIRKNQSIMNRCELLIELQVLEVINSKKFFLIKCFSTDFTPKATDQPSIFCLASIWSCKVASKSVAPKSTLLYKSC